MSYTAPSNDAVDLSGSGGYSPPSNDSVNLSPLKQTFDVLLTWDLSPTPTSDVDGQRVYRSSTSNPSFPSNYFQIASLGDSVTSYTDNGVPQGDYTYAVTAYNNAGESSPTTGTVSVLSKIGESRINNNGTVLIVPIYDKQTITNDWLRMRVGGEVGALKIINKSGEPLRARSPSRNVVGVETINNLLDLTTFTPSSSTSFTMNDCGYMDYTLLRSSSYNSNQEAYFDQDGAHDGDNFKGIQKSIDLSQYSTLEYTTKVDKIDGQYDQVVVEVGSNRVFETDSDTGPGVHNYTDRTHDVSGINSTVDVKFGHNVSGNRCRNVVSRFTDIMLK